MNKFFLFIVFAVSTKFNISAQGMVDYYVTLEYDTVRNFERISMTEKELKIRVNGKKTTIRSDSLRSLYMVGQFFEPMREPDDKKSKLLWILIEGELSLYKMQRYIYEDHPVGTLFIRHRSWAKGLVLKFKDKSLLMEIKAVDQNLMSQLLIEKKDEPLDEIIKAYNKVKAGK